MSIRNLYSFEVEFFTNRHSIEKIVTLTAQETANLYRWTFQLPLSAPVDLNEVTEAQFEDMTDELAYQYLYCYLGDPGATFDTSLLPEWIIDSWGM